MKTLIIITLMFLGSISFAQQSKARSGGTGGGGVLAEARVSQNELQVIYHAGEQGDLINFEFGQKVENEWKIQKGQIRKEELVNRPDVVKALEESLLKKDWAKIN